MNRHSSGPGADIVQMPDPNAASVNALADIDTYERSNRRGQLGAAVVFGGLLATSSAVELTGHADDARFGVAMPYWEAGQHFVNEVGDVLSTTGGAAVGGTLALLAGVKVASLFNSRAAAIDKGSSQDMSADRLRPKRSVFQRGLERYGAGRVPALASVGAALAVFASSISTEVSEGPQRPIEQFMSQITPGSAMIVNYEDAMPMVDGALTYHLQQRIRAVAGQQGVTVSTFNLDLGAAVIDGEHLTDLVFATDVPADSPIAFKPGESCTDFPVLLDKAAGNQVGKIITLNGREAKVVGTIDNLSATNRIGAEVDEQAMADCIHKNQRTGHESVDSLVVNADVATAQKILAEANQDGEIATVISKERYMENSQNFWDSNVKPITSVLALFGGIFVAAVSGSRLRETLVRNRRNWASKDSNAVSVGILRATEGLRVLKDGLLASVVGGVPATILTPVVLNALESGFHATVGAKEFLAGAGVSLAGSMLGALKSLAHPSKIIRKAESLRS